MKTSEQILDGLFEIAENAAKMLRAEEEFRKRHSAVSMELFLASSKLLSVTDALRWILFDNSERGLYEHLMDESDRDSLRDFLQPYIDALPRG